MFARLSSLGLLSTAPVIKRKKEKLSTTHPWTEINFKQHNTHMTFLPADIAAQLYEQ